MSDILLTPYNGAILGPIAKFLGWIMRGIYSLVYNLFGVENVALSIILLTVLIYLCMLPLTIKQQKYSKLSQQMQPEIKAIQDKYKNKRDQASMTAMQQETQAIYDKYGVSASGSCLQLLIQMPIFFSLYRVIYNVPAYVKPVKDKFMDLVSGIMGTANYTDTMTSIVQDYKLQTAGADFTATDEGVLSNYIVDVINRLPEKGWNALAGENGYFPDLSEVVNKTHETLESVNSLFGFKAVNISETPWNIITTNFGVMKEGFNGWALLLIIIALLIPVISYATQILNIKLMPQSANGNDQMARQMKTMNMVMPLFSFIICFTVPVGLGIYWIAGAVIRGIQQFFVNRHIQNLNLDDIIEKNKEKAKKKQEKRGIYENQIREAAQLKTRTLESKASSKTITSAERELELEKANQKKAFAKPGSMAARANMVKEFNERNSRK